MRKSLLAVLTFAVVFVGCLVVLSGSAFTGSESRTREACELLLKDAPIAALWIVCAGGFGCLLRRMFATWMQGTLREAHSNPFESDNLFDLIAMELPLGICALLLIDTWLSMLGLLGALDGILAWGVSIAGAYVWIRALGNARQDGATTGMEDVFNTHPRTSIIAFSAILGLIAALGALAASSTPLWLWSSEFGGYDALSYHLELPKQWMMLGESVIVEGNVYSHLPGYVEHAFLHLMLMRGDPWNGAYAAQFLSGFFALTAVFVSWRLARALLPESQRALAFIAPMLLLTLPWLLVVGTLAYNDTIPLLMLGAGWFLLARYSHPDPFVRRCLDPILCATALMAAVACGAKPTALLFTAVPLASLVLLRCGLRACIEIPLVLGVSVFVLLPWFLKNYADSSNPVFPFATGLFGLGEWTQAQADIFASAHTSDIPFTQRLAAYWQEFLYHGVGMRPRANEPWFPQWGILPVLGIACALALTSSSPKFAVKSLARTTRFSTICMLVLQSIAWMLCTHLKSRFLLPAAMPLAIASTLAIAPFITRTSWKIVAAVCGIALAALPLVVFLREPARGGVHAPSAFIDGLAQAHGDTVLELHRQATTDADRVATLQLLPSTVVVDAMFPPDASILTLGLASPFHYHTPFASTTVWDRGALDEVALAHAGHPERWRDALVARGYTHLLLQPTMLDVWQQSGWLNPALEIPALSAFVQTLSPAMRCSDGVIIYLLEPPKPSFAPATPLSSPPPLLTPQ
ncbi:MAG: hypothetical protein EXS10_08690 [Phycisphaerales bacterium]|nr:hypothetical protein [Phycisphaerales bacterium]